MSVTSTESNPCDDNTFSIDAMKDEIKTLVRRKFELEAKLNVLQPQKFERFLKDLPTYSQATKTNYVEESQLLHFKTKMHFYEICGIYVKADENEVKVFFHSIHTDNKYFVCIKKCTDHLEVTKYFLPPIVPIEELVENYLKVKKYVSKFCRKIYHYIAVFDNRNLQIRLFKDSEESKKIELFTSYSTHHVKLDMNLSDDSSKKISVHLKYLPDFIFPLQIILDFGGMTIEEKTVMTVKCQVFKTMPLLEATRTALLNNS